MHEYISQTHVNPPAGYICILASNIIKTGIKQIEVSFSHPIEQLQKLQKPVSIHCQFLYTMGLCNCDTDRNIL